MSAQNLFKYVRDNHIVDKKIRELDERVPFRVNKAYRLMTRYGLSVKVQLLYHGSMVEVFLPTEYSTRMSPKLCEEITFSVPPYYLTLLDKSGTVPSIDLSKSTK